MIYLYGLTEAPPAALTLALDGLNGLQGPLDITQLDGWTLVHSDHDDEEILPKRRLMLAHTRVLEAMLKTGAVLPAQFGLVGGNIDETAALVRTQKDRIAAEFDRVRGAIELGVRISFPREIALATTLDENPALQAEKTALMRKGPEAHFAIAEFGGRLADALDRRRARAQRSILDQLVPLARQHVLRTPEEDNEVLRAEFLVDLANQPAFESTVADACVKLVFAPGAEPRIRIVGPVPAYNFVRLSLKAPANEAAA